MSKIREQAGRWRSRARVASQSGDPKQVWDTGRSDEVEFWRGYLRSKGGEWPEDFEARFDPLTPVQEHIIRYVRLPKASALRILDVGAGPLTFVGKVHPDYLVEVQAVDALADDYGVLLDEEHLVPPVRTRACETERLLDIFEPESFDVTYAKNTLDHSYDPVAAIRAMAQVTRPGGPIIMLHYAYEAETEGYEGLHQWNLSLEHGRLTVSRPRGVGWTRLDVIEELGGLVELDDVIPTTVERGEDLVALRRLPD